MIQAKDVYFPDAEKQGFTVEPVLQDLIKKLLDKSEYTRLGANGWRDVLEHEWFKDCKELPKIETTFIKFDASTMLEFYD